MSRDFAKRNASPSRRAPASSSGRAPAWLWFVLGFIAGAFVMTMVFTWNSQQPKQETAPEPAKPANDNKTPKPRFDFYKLLQESETIVASPDTAPSSGDKSSENSANIEYVLQVGSFPNQTEADKLRAQLILINMEARIEPVEIHKGEIWYRVMVGPFDTQEKLAAARSALVSNQYTALVLKRAKGSKTR